MSPAGWEELANRRSGSRLARASPGWLQTRMTAGMIVLAEIAAKSDRTGEDLDCEGDYAPGSKRVHQRARRSILSSLEMRFFLTNFLVTLSAYGLTSFVYPSEATVLP